MYIYIYIYIYKLVLIAYNSCFSAKMKCKKGRKEKGSKTQFCFVSAQ